MSECLIRKTFTFAAPLLFLTSCGSAYDSTANEYFSILSEEAPCDSTTVYTEGVSVTGTGKFEKRTIELTTENTTVAGPPATTIIKLKTMALGDPLPTALPIKFAEVSVYNSSHQRVQCGVTDVSGNIKAVDGVSTLKIPNTPGSYSLRIASRSYIVHNSNPNDYTYISVKQDKYRNELHGIISNFTSTGSSSVNINLVAHARQTDSINIEAGAFNIMNSIQTAFDYIKVNTGSVDTKCLAAKLNVYWKAGFNPVQYQSPSADPQTLGNTSYYMPTTKELYISGGQLGDVSLSNTDHFDDFAIIHELGHFVEDHCGQWVSPGGNHTITSRIDPRLAWSEGWANFFAAHIIHDRLPALDSTLTAKFSVLTENNPTNFGWTYFFNSYGFSDSYQNISNGEGFVIDLKRSGTDPGAYLFQPYTGQEFDRVSPSAYPGEGHTREGAITRGLFKLSNSCSLCATSPVSFQDIWKSFDRLSGVALENNPFEGSDKILENLKTNAGSWATGAGGRRTVVESEALHLRSDASFGTSPLTWPGYGRSLASGSSCSLKIQPRADGALNNSSSDQRYSNHFYTIDFGLLPGLSYITATFTKAVALGSNVDHDIILFKPGYFFNDDYTCNAFNGISCTSFTPNRNSTNEDIYVMNREPASTLSTSYAKTIYLNGIDVTQKYLLDLRSWTAGLSIGSNTEYTYTINSNLGVLCPQ